MLKYEAQTHNFELVLETLREDVGASIDRMRTQQILINLVQNAIKYSGEGGKIWVGLKINQVEQSNHIGVTFFVRDEGVGIPLSQRHRLFAAYYRAHSAIHNKESHGLGLNICKKIAISLKGNLEFDQTVKKGTQFVATFNLQVVELNQKSQK